MHHHTWLSVCGHTHSGVDGDSISRWSLPLDDLLVGSDILCLPVPTEGGVLVRQGCCMQHHRAQHQQTGEDPLHGACETADKVCIIKV